MSAPVTSGLITISNGAEAAPLALAYYAPFYQRVSQIAVITALAVIAESSAVDGHTARQSHALQFILNSSDTKTQIQLAQTVLADATITVTSTSQTIADRLALIWSAISGA